MKPAKETFVQRNPETGAITGYPRESLLAKLPMRTDHVSALDLVHIELAVAAELLENGDDDGRRGIQRAMIALLNYFPAVGGPQATLRPILRVAEAVLDVDNGRQPAAFKVKGVGGRPETSLRASINEGQMAAILECCVLHEKAKGIHNSDYPSVDAARAAIDRYFADRNQHFRDHPKRAGKRIWGKELVPATFSEGNICKDPLWR